MSTMAPMPDWEPEREPEPPPEPQRKSPTAKLRVVLTNASDPVADVAFVAEAIDGIVMASLRASLMRGAPETPTLEKARRILVRPPNRLRFDAEKPPNFESFRPFDPFEATLQVAWNTWIRRTLYSEDRETYEDALGFATITDARRNSPLLIELSIALGVLALPPVLAIGIMRSAAKMRKAEAEAGIREAEMELKQEELQQRRLQTEILTDIRDAVRSKALAGNLQVPDGVLQAAATISSASVATLSDSSLVEKVSFSIVGGGKAA